LFVSIFGTGVGDGVGVEEFSSELSLLFLPSAQASCGFFPPKPSA
jgi:hypothetical protein